MAQTTYTQVILGGKHDADVILTIWKWYWGQKLKNSDFFIKNQKNQKKNFIIFNMIKI